MGLGDRIELREQSADKLDDDKAFDLAWVPTMWGGPLWTPGDVEKLMRDHGFVDTRTLPSPPGVPVVLVAGRRKPA